jgi:hypothetical protein
MSCRVHHAMAVTGALLAALLAAGSPAVAQVLSQNLIYTSMQPCRLFDTRVAGGALVANTDRQLNAVGVASAGSLSSQGGNPSGCPIPGYDAFSLPQVQAIVVNLAVITPAGTGVLQAWPSDQTKPDSSVMNFTAAEVVLANGVVLPVRQDTQGMDITLVSNVATQALGDVVGYFTDSTPVAGSGHQNVFLGKAAGNPTVATGIASSGFGISALNHNTSGNYNSAFGFFTLSQMTTGSSNTALGSSALGNLATGNFNTAVGYIAGGAYTAGESSNIVIGTAGAAGDHNTIRIGASGSRWRAGRDVHRRDRRRHQLGWHGGVRQR